MDAAPTRGTADDHLLERTDVARGALDEYEAFATIESARRGGVGHADPL